MSYGDFVNSLGYGCQLFYNSLLSITNMLISNYIFITILGISIFVSLIYLIFDIFEIPFHFGKNVDLDNVRKE